MIQHLKIIIQNHPTQLSATDTAEYLVIPAQHGFEYKEGRPKALISLDAKKESYTTWVYHL